MIDEVTISYVVVIDVLHTQHHRVSHQYFT